MDKDTPIIPRGYTEQTIVNNVRNKVSQRYANERKPIQAEIKRLSKQKLSADEANARMHELQVRINAEADEWIRREILDYRQSKLVLASVRGAGFTELEELSEQIEELLSRIDDLESRIDDLESQVSDVEDTPSQLDELAERVTEAENKLEEIESKIDELED